MSPVERVSSDALSFGASFRVPNAAELIAQDIRTKIVRGQLKEGGVLPPEQELTERFGVSRPVLRQALRILESERLVEVRRGQHGGAVIRRPDAATVARHFGLLLQYEGAQLQEVLQARRLLEEPAAQRATTHPDPALLETLSANLEHHAQLLAGDGLDLRLQSVANEFHNILVAHRGNTALVLLDSMLDNVIRITSESLVESQATTGDRLRLNQRSLKSHQTLYQLIKSGDDGGADSMWRTHLEEVSNHYMSTAPQSGLVVDLMSSHL